MNVDLLDAIERVGSRLEKERLLATADEDTLRLLRLAMDPDVTFGVTADDDFQLRRWKEMGPPKTSGWLRLFEETLEQLRTRQKTGNAAFVSIDGALSMAPTEAHVKWACRIINRELRLGIQLRTLNKLFPGSVKKFQVSLAEPYDPERHELRGKWILEPKLDGIRMVVVDGVGHTRNGKVVDTVGHILDNIEPEVKKDWVLDGELIGSRGFDEGSGAARRKGQGPQRDLHYHVFDVIRRDEWETRKTRALTLRKNDVNVVWMLSRQLDKMSFVEWNEFTHPSYETLASERDRYVSKGYEGVMIKDADAPYIFDRSNFILKLKPFKDMDGVIVGFYEGKNRHVGRLGGVEVSFNGVVTRVGGGFSDLQREELWRDRAALVGRMVEVQYQDVTKDGVLRFPVFIRFRPDKES